VRYQLILLGLVCMGVPATANPIQAVPGGIEGRVTDGDGLPIRDAMARAGAKRTKTDSLGRYTLDGLPAGRVAVRFMAIGWDARDTTVTVGDGRRTRVDIQLVDGYRTRLESHLKAAGNAGTIDSMAEGLMRTEASGFTYESFGTRLLAHLVGSRTADANTIVSPLSGGQALAIALLGAAGSTANGIASALGATEWSGDSLAAVNSRFIDRLGRRTDVTLRVANALWVDSSARVQPAFTSRISALYPGAFRTTPLYRQVGIERINQWADSMTSGKISRVFSAPLDSAVKLVITNAVYIKAAWLMPFDTVATRDRPFLTGDGRKVEIPTMDLTTVLAHRREALYQSVRLPFRAGLTALYVILPDSGVSTSQLLSEVNSGGWRLPDAVNGQRKVHLQLPRLHLEDTLDLASPLSAMGMATAFDPDRADFSKMFVLQGEENASIGRASQRVTLDLDEEGAVAAAVTALDLIVPTGVRQKPPPIQFLVNRPFLFLLRDERSGSALFVGHIANPKGS